MAKLEKNAICNWQNEFDPDDLFAFGATFTEENEIDVRYFNVFVEMESDRERENYNLYVSRLHTNVSLSLYPCF